MSKAAVHVEVKLMWTGRDMELLVVFNQPFPSVASVAPPVCWLQHTGSTGLQSWPSFSALSQAAHTSNQVCFIQLPGGWCLGSGGLGGALLPWSVPRMVQRLVSRGGLRPTCQSPLQPVQLGQVFLQKFRSRAQKQGSLVVHPGCCIVSLHTQTQNNTHITSNVFNPELLGAVWALSIA